MATDVGSSLADLLCLAPQSLPRLATAEETEAFPGQADKKTSSMTIPPFPNKKKRGIAVSGTGNGGSSLRTAAARTACALVRFSSTSSLVEAVTASPVHRVDCSILPGNDGKLRASERVGLLLSRPR